MSLVIDAVDATLKELLTRRVQQLQLPTPPVTAAQVGFQPPDREWRSVVKGLGARLGLNVYLVDLRENRRLRSNERIAYRDAGSVIEEPAPMRLDCHYLITAWSPATEAAGRTVAEHMLLSDVVTVLNAVPELVPRQVFTPGGLPALFPTRLADSPLPVALTPPEGFPKLAEFWGTMLGQAHPWKPAVYLVVTVPVLAEPDTAGADVTTVMTEYRHDAQADSAELVLHIGGVALDASVAPATPIPGAWIRLDDAAGQILGTTHANERGEFTFGGLAPGSYALTARAPGHAAPPTLPITVPAPSGRYDLQFN